MDDKLARNGTASFGGPGEATFPFDQILQILEVWRVGGYITCHHDRSQTGYDSATAPPQGVPDPKFSPCHRNVLESVALQARCRQDAQ